jgi:hypothetical protein
MLDALESSILRFLKNREGYIPRPSGKLLFLQPEESQTLSDSNDRRNGWLLNVLHSRIEAKLSRQSYDFGLRDLKSDNRPEIGSSQLSVD